MQDHRLPQEIIDYILDLLRDESKTLKQCCLVSGSWVPRARTHLFHRINFDSTRSRGFDDWKNAFPEPKNSPVSFAHTLSIWYPGGITEVLGEGGWIQSFSHVVRLEIRTGNVIMSISQVFKLICSLPLLEDLEIPDIRGRCDDDDGTISKPSTSPPLTGTLQLILFKEMEHVTRRLLDLPSGISFRRFTCVSFDIRDNARWITALVERCAETLEYFCIGYRPLRGGEDPSIDLSKATSLREVEFIMLNLDDVVWVGSILKTLTSEHKDLRRISILILLHRNSDDELQILETQVRDLWTDLDHTLTKLWESNATATRVTYATDSEETEARKVVEQLLPEVPGRRIVDRGCDSG